MTALRSTALRQARQLACSLCCIGALLGAPAPAATAPLTLGSFGPTEGSRLLRRAQEAARHRNYAGTFVINLGRSMSSSRIVHFNDGREQIERLDILDGRARRIYRHNNVVHVFWPATQIASIEPREPVGAFPTPWPADLELDTERYELVQGGSDRIAGLDALVWTFKPRDALRYAFRLWLEPQSSLLLRADVLNDRGELLESTAYSDLQASVRPQTQVLVQEMRRLTGYQVTRLQVERTDLARAGWSLRGLPAGFQLVRSVRRPIGEHHATPVAASATSAPAPESTMLQTVFSDGLTQVSVYIEPFDPLQHQRESHAAMGATYALSRRQADWWITAVGDAPALTLLKFVNAMERLKP